MRFRWVGLFLAIAVVISTVLVVSKRRTIDVPATLATVSATTRIVATTQAVPALPPRSLFDVLKLDHPAAVATTQPLGVPVDAVDAARLIVDRPIYLDEAGHLWITHPNAPRIDAVLRDKPFHADSTLATSSDVVFVYWMVREGKSTPAVFTPNFGGTFAVHTGDGKSALVAMKGQQFARALSLPDRLALPCDDGVSVLTFGDGISDSFQPLPRSDDPILQPQVIREPRGLLAFSPASSTRPGSGVFRFQNDQWIKLNEQDWPTSIFQITPFLDGSVQQLRHVKGGKIEIVTVLLDAVPIDEKRVLDLIDQLSDDNEARRNQATRELARIGPAGWPIMRKAIDDQLPEAQQRLEMLLSTQAPSTLGLMSLVDAKVRLAARYPNGGLLLYAPAGVTIPKPGDDDSTVAPAWICVRPDAPPELLPDLITADLRPGLAEVFPLGGDWIISDDVHGPRRFVGNHLQPMLRKSEKAFAQPIGADRRGRWLFRKPGQHSPTLIIDPTIPDARPRLPVWTIRLKEGAAGWSKDDYPAIQRGGAWELRDNNWKALDAKTNPIQTEYTKPPTTNPTTQPHGQPLLITADGTSYFDGKQKLIAVDKADREIEWDLPSTAVGVDPVHLIEDRDGRLFLFNQPGRVLRLSKTPDGFRLDATFGKNIPTVDNPARIWLDPAGRICIAWERNIAVMFPTGRVPRDIWLKMSSEEIEANEPE